MSNSYVPTASSQQFYIPTTLASDFANFLNNDIPNVVMTFTVWSNWYDQFVTGHTTKTIRAEIYPNSTKSRFENSDNRLNFRSTVDSGIKRGDIVVDPSNNIYLLDWAIEPSANDASTAALLCNCYLTFKRYRKEVVDSDGILVTEAGYDTIASAMPCNMSEYEGRPEYAMYSGTPGISNDAIMTMYTQFNANTKNIKRNDEFTYFDEGYTVIDIDRVGVDIGATSGVLKMSCRKKAGEGA